MPLDSRNHLLLATVPPQGSRPDDRAHIEDEPLTALAPAEIETLRDGAECSSPARAVPPKIQAPRCVVGAAAAQRAALSRAR